MSSSTKSHPGSGRGGDQANPADATLVVDGAKFRASDTDEKLVELLSGLSWVYSPIFGLEGGVLGRLSRDIRSGRLTLPGRSRGQSLDLLAEALDRSRELNRRWQAEDRKRWWRRRGPSLALITLLSVALIAGSVFSDAILASLPEATGSADDAPSNLARDVYEVGTAIVFPVVGAIGLIYVAVFAIASLRSGPQA